MFVYNQNPEMRKPPYSVKQTGSPVPTVPELYKDNPDACLLFS